jgi:hypothetical protein
VPRSASRSIPFARICDVCGASGPRLPASSGRLLWRSPNCSRTPSRSAQAPGARPYRRARAPSAGPVRDHADHAGPGHSGRDLVAKITQALRHNARRPMLGEGEFRVSMQITVDGSQFFEVGTISRGQPPEHRGQGRSRPYTPPGSGHLRRTGQASGPEVCRNRQTPASNRQTSTAYAQPGRCQGNNRRHAGRKHVRSRKDVRAQHGRRKN